jgi:uncharacterized sulfatase
VKQKNILLITSDQQRWDTLGVYNDKIKTPNLDKLAARGMVFDRAYTVNPVCTPTRCSMLTGHYPSRHGCYAIGTSLPDDYPTIPAELSKNGYFTSLIGKGHFQSCMDEESFEAPPSIHRRDFFKSWNGPWFGFEHVETVIGHSVEKHAPAMHYGVWLEEQGVDISKYFGNHDYIAWGTWDLPEKYHNSTWVADRTIEAVKKASSDEKPFFIWSSFQDPHNPCLVPEPWASMYKPEDVPYLHEVEGEMKDRPSFYQNMLDKGNFGWDDKLGKKNWHCVRNTKGMELSEADVRDIMTKYWGMVSLMDKHIGRIIDHLESTGEIDNTIIIFTSDHGDYMGNHGMWWKGLAAYEDIHRVPYIVSHPECKTKGEHSRSYQSVVDFGKSFLAATGTEIPKLVQGVDQNPSWVDKDISCREWAQIEWRPTESPFMQKVFLCDDYKLVVYHGLEEGELYNLVNDPEQKKNLWDEPASADIKYKLMQKMISAEMDKDGELRTRVKPA